jgi:uncharacterized protein YggU (UPF0235/DUF167 family)
LRSRAFTIEPDHARLSVRLTPSGGRDCFEGPELDADGALWLKARVTSPPEGGKANKALVALLSRSIRHPKMLDHFSFWRNVTQKNPPDRGRSGGSAYQA